MNYLTIVRVEPTPEPNYWLAFCKPKYGPQVECIITLHGSKPEIGTTLEVEVVE